MAYSAIGTSALQNPPLCSFSIDRKVENPCLSVKIHLGVMLRAIPCIPWKTTEHLEIFLFIPKCKSTVFR